MPSVSRKSYLTCLLAVIPKGLLGIHSHLWSVELPVLEILRVGRMSTKTVAGSFLNLSLHLTLNQQVTFGSGFLERKTDLCHLALFNVLP